MMATPAAGCDSRLEAVRTGLDRDRLDALLVTGRQNVQYLSGFKGEGGLVITQASLHLLTSALYLEEAGALAPAFELIRADAGIADGVAGLVARLGAGRVGFEEDHLTFREFSEIAARASSGSWELVPVRGAVEDLRQVKDASEIESIRRACSIVVNAFARAVEGLGAGACEADIAADIEWLMRKCGAERIAFESIVVSGPRGSLPHGSPTSRRIERGDLVTMDFGAVWNSYCSDMTRTVSVGEPPRDLLRVYDTVRRAHEAALAAIRPGLRLREADAAARSVIVDAGYGEYFSHGLGHGVGLAVHEGPRVSPKAPEGGVILEGMVFTVEPGIYVPGVGGVRIEDTIVVRSDGAEVLTGYPVHLIRL